MQLLYQLRHYLYHLTEYPSHPAQQSHLAQQSHPVRLMYLDLAIFYQLVMYLAHPVQAAMYLAHPVQAAMYLALPVHKTIGALIIGQATLITCQITLIKYLAIVLAGRWVLVGRFKRCHIQLIARQVQVKQIVLPL